jgi:hypothetical protein
MKHKLDPTDRKILEILQADSNITNAQLITGNWIVASANAGTRKET